MRPYEFPGGVAVVTGAASGIGRALALALAARGSHLALVDRDAAGLEATAAGLETLFRTQRPRGRVRVSLHVLDLSEGEVAGLERDVLEAHGRVTLLVNNAGVALGGTFEELSIEEYEWLMNINFRAVVRLTHAFLPALLGAGGRAPGERLERLRPHRAIWTERLRGEQVRGARLFRGAAA